MALSPFKTFAAGEILTAADLNSSFSYLTSNGLQLISPLTGSLDMDGQTLIMDSDADSSLRVATDDVLTMKLNNTDLFVWNGATASVVNGITMTASVTGSPPVVAATGSDTNIDLQVRSKGTGDVILADATGEQILIAADVASAVNEITVTNAATGNSPSIAATGDDSNVGLTISPKGTGAVLLDGAVSLKQGSDVASASALPVNVSGTFFDVTGTTSVTSMNSRGVGSLSVLHFDSALTLTHNSADLVLPGGRDIVVDAGFIGGFYEYASGDVRLMFDNARAYTTARYTTTGLTDFQFTDIPAWATKLTLLISSMSMSGADAQSFVIGDAGGYETTGYNGNAWQLGTGSTAVSTSDFPLSIDPNATYNWRGVVNLYLAERSSNLWVVNGNLQSGGSQHMLLAGSKALSQTLDRLKIQSNGASTFDIISVALRVEP